MNGRITIEQNVSLQDQDPPKDNHQSINSKQSPLSFDLTESLLARQLLLNFNISQENLKPIEHKHQEEIGKKQNSSVEHKYNNQNISNDDTNINPDFRR